MSSLREKYILLMIDSDVIRVFDPNPKSLCTTMPSLIPVERWCQSYLKSQDRTCDWLNMALNINIWKQLCQVQNFVFVLIAMTQTSYLACYRKPNKNVSTCRNDFIISEKKISLPGCISSRHKA